MVRIRISNYSGEILNVQADSIVTHRTSFMASFSDDEAIKEYAAAYEELTGESPFQVYKDGNTLMELPTPTDDFTLAVV